MVHLVHLAPFSFGCFQDPPHERQSAFGPWHKAGKNDNFANFKFQDRISPFMKNIKRKIFAIDK